MPDLKEILEAGVDTDRFSMVKLRATARPLLEAHAPFAKNIPTLQTALGARIYNKFIDALIRHVFLIELVKLPKVETTKFQVRWCDQLSKSDIDENEQQLRYCSFEECVDIVGDILGQLNSGWLDEPNNKESIQLFFSNSSLLPYEAPIDYYNPVPKADVHTRIHRRGNVGLISSPTILQTLRLRQLLTDSRTSPDSNFFKRVLNKKIKVKTYLTDRVLTGPHKTNREKRWEAHPHSEHFATRSDCLEIEHRLLHQLIHFEGFPESARKALRERAAVPIDVTAVSCPITLEPLDFGAFHGALMNARHGKSDFQVGHLNPLKLGEAGRAAGHTADNISWVSADGNRIQGSYSLVRTRALVYQISQRYEAAGIVPDILKSIEEMSEAFKIEEAVVEEEETARQNEEEAALTSETAAVDTLSQETRSSEDLQPE